MTMTAGTLSLCLALAAPGLILLVVAFRALLRTAGTRRSRNGALRPAARARLVPIRHRVRLDAFSRDIGIAPLLIARLIPIMSFNLINYAAGLAGVPRWTFIWTTGLGILPLTVLSVLLGSQALHLPVYVWTLAGVAALLLLMAIRAARRLITSQRSGNSLEPESAVNRRDDPTP